MVGTPQAPGIQAPDEDVDEAGEHPLETPLVPMPMVGTIQDNEDVNKADDNVWVVDNVDYNLLLNVQECGLARTISVLIYQKEFLGGNLQS